MSQLTLLAVGVGGVELVAHDVLQHRVPQELQTLVVVLAHGGVRQRLAQKLRVLEVILQRVHQCLHRIPPFHAPTSRPEDAAQVSSGQNIGLR